MNIEIANRLQKLRKQSGLSQEELAQKLGLSRQSVSKWERAEASPDTDNLILLSRLYGVSLDELLFTEDDIPDPEEEATEEKAAEAPADSEPEPFDTHTVDTAGSGIHISENGEEVHVSWKGVHVKDKNGEEVYVGPGGVRVHSHKHEGGDCHIPGCSCHAGDHIVFGKSEASRKAAIWHKMPFALAVVTAFLLCGFFNWLGGWGLAWMLFLLIPLYHSLVDALCKHKPTHFAYPVLAALVFLMLGFMGGWWHPGWVVFLTVPAYYSIAAAFEHHDRPEIMPDDTDCPENDWQENDD